MLLYRTGKSHRGGYSRRSSRATPTGCAMWPGVRASRASRDASWSPPPDRTARCSFGCPRGTRPPLSVPSGASAGSCRTSRTSSGRWAGRSAASCSPSAAATTRCPSGSRRSRPPTGPTLNSPSAATGSVLTTCFSQPHRTSRLWHRHSLNRNTTDLFLRVRVLRYFVVVK